MFNFKIIPNKKYIIIIVSFLDKDTYLMYNIHGCNIEKYINLIKDMKPKSAIFINDKCVHKSIFNNNDVKKCVKTIKEIMNNDKLTLKFIENCIA